MMPNLPHPGRAYRVSTLRPYLRSPFSIISSASYGLPISRRTFLRLLPLHHRPLLHPTKRTWLRGMLRSLRRNYHRRPAYSLPDTIFTRSAHASQHSRYLPDSSLTVHCFIITAVSLSSKSHCDAFCTNVHDACVGSLAPAELTCLECAFSLSWTGEPASSRSSKFTTSTSSCIPAACSTSSHPLLTSPLLPPPLFLPQLLRMRPTPVTHPLLPLLGVHWGAIPASCPTKLCSIHLRMALLGRGTLES